MIEKIYRIDVSVIKDRKTISQISEYYDNIDECIDVANKITKEVTEAYKKKYSLEIVDLDQAEYKSAHTFATKWIYPFKIHKEYVKIDLVEMVSCSSHTENIKAIVRNISEG